MLLGHYTGLTPAGSLENPLAENKCRGSVAIVAETQAK